MSGEIIEISQSDIKKELTVNSADIERVVGHLKIIKEFVSQALNEGINSDYAVIPGTPKKSLLKPGAEKLMRLFGLGARFTQTEKDFDPVLNFALFTYKAEIYHLKSGVTLAECEGSANSQEKKYKERNTKDANGKWKKDANGNLLKEQIPVCDIRNTLMKMAQKRALVGGVITAVGASDYFSQDEDEIENQVKAPKQRQYTDSSKFEQDKDINFAEYVVQVGKHKGKPLKEINGDDINQTVNYWTAKGVELTGPLLQDIQAMRNHLNMAG